ncbi:glycosyltransferase [Geobacillus stearothermophilus]|nr:glycosyltransferase [Geobacillus stearothermophilus]
MNKKIPFDQYQRYKNAAEIINLIREENQSFTILEVGANEHRNLEHFLPKDQVTYLDIEVPEHLKHMTNYIEADATNMPLDDNAFDFVIALDVFEHIPPDKRNQFLFEINRVAKEGFLIAAPFNTEGVEETEIRVNEYYKALYGEGFRWLEEHRQYTLPNLEETEDILRKENIEYVKFEHGSLLFWEKLMRLHFLVADRNVLHDYRFMIDDFYNKNIYEVDYIGPCYRNFIVVCRDKAKREFIQSIYEKRKQNSYLKNSTISKLNELENSIYSLKIIDKENQIYKKSLEITEQLLEDLKLKEQQIIEKIQTIKKKTEMIELQNQKIQELKIECENKSIENNNLYSQLLEKENYIKQLQNQAESMRIKNRLKKILNFSFIKYVRKIINIIFRRKFKFKLQPVHHLEWSNGKWLVLGRDPHFILKGGSYPSSWTIIQWRASANSSALLRLYYDTGGGFSENQSFNLGKIGNDINRDYECVICLPENIHLLRLDIEGEISEFELENLTFTSISRLEVFYKSFINHCRKRNIKNYKELYSLIKKLFILVRREGLKSIWYRAKQKLSMELLSEDPYEVFLNVSSKVDKEIVLSEIKKLKYKPKFSVILPVYNVEEKWLRKCIDSVLNQWYPYWELCIVDDNSSKDYIKPVLEEYSNRDSRIKTVFRSNNGHISEASNTALEIATGDFIALLDHDDELAPEALYENAVLLNEHPDADMIYSDEDKITKDGKRHSPLFKPDWSPDTLRSQMYIGHLTVYRTNLVRQLGGFRKGFEGSQDYDLALRVAEKTNNIYHIPKILYSWREIETSTAVNPSSKPYAHEAGLKALNEHLERVFGKGKAWAEETEYLFVYDVRYAIPEDYPLVSIIIPTKDNIELLSSCIQSILDKTTYPNYEILIMNNNSVMEETYSWFDKQKENSKIRIIDAMYEFNWSKLNNHGIREANGEVFVFLNNDTIVISEDWLQRLVEKALREDVGTVGGLLLYEDNTIQHAGVVIGMGGWADHVYKGMHPVHNTSPFISPVINRNVSASTGACLAIAKKVIEKIGGFNEEFIICGSDVEISLRALKMGYVNIYDPYVRLYHLESKTRDSFIPERDFELSAKYYSPYREIGDPYYNQNLSYNHLIPTIRS